MMCCFLPLINRHGNDVKNEMVHHKKVRQRRAPPILGEEDEIEFFSTSELWAAWSKFKSIKCDDERKSGLKDANKIEKELEELKEFYTWYWTEIDCPSTSQN